jgi:methionyl-tRNA synthetase
MTILGLSLRMNMETKHPNRYTVTAALPYANGPLHLGHLSGAYLPADIYVRLLRLKGKDVVFICGSDEHGAAITVRAKKEGLSPRDIIDKYHALNGDTFRRLGISFDIFHRTSDPLHHETARDFFRTLYDKGGEFLEEETQQYYDEKFAQFLADRFITGECPRCGNPEAYGDQCERCGSDLSPTELKNPRSTLSGEPPVLRPTKHWYFRLDKHAEWLKAWIQTGMLDGVPHHDPHRWRNHVTGQCLSWLDNGLQPRAITRDLDWGISLPLDSPDAAGKVLYVWFDAPIGYISATRQWAADTGRNWEDYWKKEDTSLVHFIGKDNIVFHCIVFPAMLRAHGGYILPQNVPANQFLNFEGRKFSKSKGWGIEQHQYLEDFAGFDNKEDALRYYLIKSMPEQKDGDFKWDEFVEAHDNELVANLGNFVNRVLTLTQNYFGGLVPDFDGAVRLRGPVLEKSDTVAGFLHGEVLPQVEQIAASIEAFEFKNALKAFMDLSSLGNAFLQNNAPWAARKADPDAPEVAATLYGCLQLCAALSVTAQPFLPFTSDKLRQLLGLAAAVPGDLERLCGALRGEAPAVLPSGHLVSPPVLLFAKINDPRDPARSALVAAQKARIEAILAEEASVPAPRPEVVPVAPALKDPVDYDTFSRLDIRTATVLAAERVEKADKLLKLTVDLGFEQRTVVSGIAQHYAPEALVGRQVLLLANLEPRKLRGIVSQGMILTAEHADGRLSLVSPEEGFGNGWAVK